MNRGITTNHRTVPLQTLHRAILQISHHLNEQTDEDGEQETGSGTGGNEEPAAAGRVGSRPLPPPAQDHRRTNPLINTGLPAEVLLTKAGERRLTLRHSDFLRHLAFVISSTRPSAIRNPLLISISSKTSSYAPLPLHPRLPLQALTQMAQAQPQAQLRFSPPPSSPPLAATRPLLHKPVADSSTSP
jgi:hypothetical protein